jgi:hypothetical protein
MSDGFLLLVLYKNKKMTITELYNQLCDKDFQNHQTGNLFFPAYMYMYNPELEYEVEKEILNIKNRLHRPNNYLDVMVLDIFEEKQRENKKNMTTSACADQRPSRHSRGRNFMEMFTRRSACALAELWARAFAPSPAQKISNIQ